MFSLVNMVISRKMMSLSSLLLVTVMNRYKYSQDPRTFTIKNGQVWKIKKPNTALPPVIIIGTNNRVNIFGDELDTRGEEKDWEINCETKYYPLKVNYLNTNEIYEHYELDFPEKP